MALIKDTQLELHRMMMLIRLFEEALEEMFSRGLLHGTMHLSLGQEATAAGACLALDIKDFISFLSKVDNLNKVGGLTPKKNIPENIQEDLEIENNNEEIKKLK